MPLPSSRRPEIAMRLARFVLALLLIAGTPLRAQEAPPPSGAASYLDPTALDLTRLLPSPPAADSQDTRVELGEVLVLQINRTPEMVGRARADAVQEVWRFADVIGPRFTPEALPRTAALFARLVATEEAVTDPAKLAFGRKRPFLVSELVQPLMRPNPSGSWPSSHAALGTLMGIVLGDMLPEKRAAIMDRAWAYAINRVVAGMHFPSDIEMGRIAGTVIAAAVMARPDFRADFEAARTELRGVLGP